MGWPKEMELVAVDQQSLIQMMSNAARLDQARVGLEARWKDRWRQNHRSATLDEVEFDFC